MAIQITCNVVDDFFTNVINTIVVLSTTHNVVLNK